MSKKGRGEARREGGEREREKKIDDRNVENHREAFNWRQKFRKG